jgi:hypothetical protein
MKKTILIFAILIFASAKINAQMMMGPMSKADSLRQEGDMTGAIEEFKKMYKANPKDENNIYNYACALSVTNQIDSAFKYLYLNIEMDTSIQAFRDPDFLHLRESPKWDAFENRLTSLLVKLTYMQFNKDIEYAKKLWLMLALDQAYYVDIDIADKKIGKNSSVSIALWDLKEKINKENQKELEKLIETKGWPKQSEVGGAASTAAFLIIQHSDLKKQEKYLPIIKKLCELKEADWGDYALIYDRLQTSANKPQKYGSQVKYNDQTKKYELFPLEDEAKVDEWRKEVGLGPLSEYVSGWGIVFTPKK